MKPALGDGEHEDAWVRASRNPPPRPSATVRYGKQGFSRVSKAVDER